MQQMQYRKNNKPRISSPPGSHSSLGPIDDDKPRRSSSRTFGIANRVWLVVLCLLATIFLLHRLIPGHSQPPLPSYASGDLKPTNYLNVSSPSSSPPPNPFPFCPTYGPTDTLATKYNAGTLQQTQRFLGTGYRVQRVLRRALSGQPVTISIIGGSISACHGAGNDPVSPKCYPSKFFDWWNQIFPHPATEITNGAMRRTNSDYFGYCSAHHLPDVTDLVIVELDSDDTTDRNRAQNFEFLVRSILNRPDQPAVVILGHFSPQVHETWGFSGPDQWHSIVANFYDVPHLTTRPLLYNEYTQDPDSIRKKYYVDPILAGPEGHTLLSDVLVAYFQSVTCQLWNIITGEEYDSSTFAAAGGSKGGLFGGLGQRKGVPEPKPKADSPSNDDPDSDSTRPKPDPNLKSSDPRLKIPPSLLSSPPSSSSSSNKKFEEIAPYCVSANDLINPLPPSLFYGSGWQAYHPSTSQSSSRHDEIKGGATAAHYFYSTLPMSKIRIPIVIGHGDVGIYYLREERGRAELGSEVECWVDDNYQGRKKLENRLEGKSGVEVTLMMIDHGVPRGSHYIECQLMGEEGQGVPMFKIVGVFAN